MSKRETQAGRETWEFICMVVSPVLPKVATITQIKDAAYVVFQVGKDFPAARVDEAAQRRNGWDTKAAFEHRARELCLPVHESPWKIEKNDEKEKDYWAHYGKLQSLAASLRARGTEHGRTEAIAIEWMLENSVRHIPPVDRPPFAR